MKIDWNKIPIVKPAVDAAVNFLNARNQREKLMVLVFGGIFIFTVDYFLWLGPVVNVLTRTVPILSSLHEELDALKTDQKAAPEIKKKWDGIQNELSEKEKGFQGADQLPALLENLSKLASESGVRITSVKPVGDSVPVGSKLYFSVPIQVNASAGAHELGAFLSKLETDETFYKITDLKIEANPSNPRKHVIGMMLETYRKA